MTQPSAMADAAMAEALAARRAGDLPGSIARARAAAELDPTRLDAWFVWGAGCMAVGQFGAAEQVLGQAAALAPPHSAVQGRILAQRARALVTLGRGSEASAAAHDALACGLTDPDTLNTVGTALAQAGQPELAEAPLRAAVAAQPASGAYAYDLGAVLRVTGAIDAAAACFEKAIRLGDLSAAHLALAGLRRVTPDSHRLPRLQRAFTSARSPLDAARIAYALFKENDDLGDVAAAWTWLEQGAAAARTFSAWSAAEERATTEATIAAFPATRFADITPRASPGPRRIFIVGLPRSGTTLVERILAAHSDVHAMGELQTFGLVCKWATGSKTPALWDADTAQAAAAVDPAALAAAYTRETAYLAGSAAVTIDKLPHNHDYAGLIRRAFPDAVIVHVRRAPMDALFGAYKLLFAHAHRWSYAQADLAAHFASYTRLMAHWRACLGESLIDIGYEALVADPDAEIRRLLAACGLTFQPACLRPHETAGAVATASAVQVRRPINAEGIGAWRRYRHRLEPLRAQLETMKVVNAAGDPI